MSRTRSVTRLVPALALALAIGALTLAPAEAAEPVRPRIQGTVVDGKGQGILDALAVAVVGSQPPKASWLSYNSTDPDVREDLPGYFYLESGYGVFTVKVTKKGWVPVTMRGVEVADARGERVESLGEIVLLKTTSLTAAGPSGTVRAGDRVKLAVTVVGKKPTGKVLVKAGRQTVGSYTLRAGDLGRHVFNLGRLAKGDHAFKVVYVGSSYFGSSERTVRIEVQGKKRNNRPANALIAS